MWRNSDTLYSCSKDQFFRIQKVSQDAYYPCKNLNASSLSWSVKGQLAFSLPKKEKNINQLETVGKKPLILNRWDDKTPISIPYLKPDQFSGMLESETVDEEAFLYFAQFYKTQGKDKHVFDRNAQVTPILCFLQFFLKRKQLGCSRDGTYSNCKSLAAFVDFIFANVLQKRTTIS